MDRKVKKETLKSQFATFYAVFVWKHKKYARNVPISSGEMSF